MDTRDGSASAEQIDAAHRMRAQQLSLVFSQVPGNQILSPMIGTLMSAALWDVADHRLLAAWVLTLAGISLWRHRLTRSYHDVTAGPEQFRAWERRFLMSLAAISAAWGVGGWVLMPPHSNAYQALIYCSILGMAGGTAAVYAAHGLSVAVAVSLIISPATVYLFTFGDLFHATMAIGGLLLVLAVSRGARVMNEVMQRNIQLAWELDRSARLDSLSGLANRRGFTEFGTGALANASRAGRSCALIMIDVDDFKAINDRLGHAGGDAVIRALGAMLAAAVRAGECAGRVGGEEFAVFLPDAGTDQALAVADRILSLVRTTPVAFEDRQITTTVSVGIAATEGKPSTLDDLMVQADKALYTAKRQGRDRVVTSDARPAV